MKITLYHALLTFEKERAAKNKVVSLADSDLRHAASAEDPSLSFQVPEFVAEGRFIYDPPPLLRLRNRS